MLLIIRWVLVMCGEYVVYVISLFGCMVFRVFISRLCCSGVSLVRLVGVCCYCVFGWCCNVLRFV